MIHGELVTESMQSYITQIITSDTSAFIKLPNELIMQKIVYDVKDNSKPIEISFPVCFPHNLFNISNFGLCDSGFYIKKTDRSRLEIDLSNFIGEQLQLIAIGY